MARRASGNDQIGNTVISMASIDAARRIMLSGRFVAAGRVVGSTSLSIWRFASDYVMAERPRRPGRPRVVVTRLCARAVAALGKE